MGACPCFAGFRVQENPNHRKCTFQPGRLGIQHEDGLIEEVDEGQAQEAGVKEGWKMISLDGETYSEKRFLEFIKGSEPYVITFDIRGKNATKEQDEKSLPKLLPPESPEAASRKFVEKQKPAHEIHDSDSEDPPHLRTFSFQSGRLGIGHDDGVVTEVSSGQANDVGVKVGWKMVKCAGKPYSEDALDKATSGTTSYVMTFDTCYSIRGTAKNEKESLIPRKESTESVASAASAPGPSRPSFFGWGFRQRRRANSAIKGANGISTTNKKVRFSV